MGLDLHLRRSGRHVYGRSYGAYHHAKSVLCEYYDIANFPQFYFPYKKKEGSCPIVDLTMMKRLIKDNDKERDKIEAYKKFLTLLKEKGIQPLGMMILHSDCDGFIPWEYSEKMIPLIEPVVSNIPIINGEEYFDDYGVEVLLELLNAFKLSAEEKDDIIFA